MVTPKDAKTTDIVLREILTTAGSPGLDSRLEKDRPPRRSHEHRER